MITRTQDTDKRLVGDFGVTEAGERLRTMDVDIAAWLRGLDLAQYEQAFRENAVDCEVLPELTDTDLEKLGVLLGHLRQILRAFAGITKPMTSPAAAPVFPARAP